MTSRLYLVLTKPLGKFTGILSLFLIIALSISLVNSVLRMKRTNLEILEKEKRVREMESKEENLQNRLNEVKSMDFMEQQLRDNLGLSKDGEIVVILPPEDVVRSYAPKFEEEEEALPDPTWKKWLKLFI